jgi:hypothetical protein
MTTVRASLTVIPSAVSLENWHFSVRVINLKSKSMENLMQSYTQPSMYSDHQKSDLSSTVNHRILDRLVLEWSFFGHFLNPVFEWFFQDGCQKRLPTIRKLDKKVRFTNGEK